MSEGWIKLHRKLQDNALWGSETFTRGQAWVDLILLANHKDGFIYVRDHRIDLKRGDVGWSQNKLADRWSWSRTKVRSFLDMLEKEQQIEQVKSRSYTVIRLKNYKEYQKNDTEKTTEKQEEDNRKTREKQQKDTNKNVKNDKNEKKDYVQFVDLWNEVNDCNLRVTDKKRESIRARLSTFSEEEIKTAIRNRSKDEWINGEGQKFKGNWDSFWRNDEKVERYLLKNSSNGLDNNLRRKHSV